MFLKAQPSCDKVPANSDVDQLWVELTMCDMAPAVGDWRNPWMEIHWNPGTIWRVYIKSKNLVSRKWFSHVSYKLQISSQRPFWGWKSYLYMEICWNQHFSGKHWWNHKSSDYYAALFDILNLHEATTSTIIQKHQAQVHLVNQSHPPHPHIPSSASFPALGVCSELSKVPKSCNHFSVGPTVDQSNATNLTTKPWLRWMYIALSLLQS